MVNQGFLTLPKSLPFQGNYSHQALKWLLSQKEPSGRLGRCILELQQDDL